jgi:hypothetical protein
VQATALKRSEIRWIVSQCEDHSLSPLLDVGQCSRDRTDSRFSERSSWNFDHGKPVFPLSANRRERSDAFVVIKETPGFYRVEDYEPVSTW